MIGNFGKKKTNEYFGAGPYYIPEYQRDYTWEDKTEVKELWEDVRTVYSEGMSEYFLGQIVVHKDSEDGKSYIIDGQQRSITLVLLLVAIRNTYTAIKKATDDESSKTTAEKAAQKIDSLLSIIDIDDHEEKLVLSEEHHDFFSKNILYGDADKIKNSKPKNKADKNLVKAYLFLYNCIAEFIANDTVSEQITKLKSLNKVITENLCMLYVETTNESEAYMIFETLNARGRDLETSDLLKNYFFRISKGNLNAVKKNWQAMASKFEDESITSYIRCLWNSQFEITREKMLYKKITEKYTTPKDALELSTLLLESSDIYLSLIDPNNKHCFKDEKDKNSLEQVFCEFSDLKMKTFFPLVLAYYNTYKSKPGDEMVAELLKIAQAVEKLTVRDIIIAKRNPNSYESTFAEIARNISNMSISTTDEIIDKLKAASISDAEFEVNFKNYVGEETTPGKNKIRYILRRIINYQAKEMKVSRDNSEVHIEHIMPQTKGDWPVSDEKHKEYLWRLGNLTLLDFLLNDHIQNGLYDIKCPSYLKSEIKMTHDLPSSYPTWDIPDEDDKPNSIVIRQSDLYEDAKAIWSF